MTKATIFIFLSCCVIESQAAKSSGELAEGPHAFASLLLAGSPAFSPVLKLPSAQARGTQIQRRSVPLMDEDDAPPSRAERPESQLKDKTEYALLKNYPKDARRMVDNMAICSELKRGTPDLDETITETRNQMVQFVSYYRSKKQIASTPSFTTLYTAVSTLNGHYLNYGNRYPVPEKRKERLREQYKEIDRALARGK